MIQQLSTWFVYDVTQLEHEQEHNTFLLLYSKNVSKCGILQRNNWITGGD